MNDKLENVAVADGDTKPEKPKNGIWRWLGMGLWLYMAVMLVAELVYAFSVPVDIFDPLGFICLFPVLVTLCITFLRWKKGVSEAGDLVFIFWFSLFMTAIGSHGLAETTKYARLFNIPLGGQYTEANMKKWSEVFEDHEIIQILKEEAVDKNYALWRLKPKGQPDNWDENAPYSASVNKFDYANIEVMFNSSGQITSVGWLREIGDGTVPYRIVCESLDEGVSGFNYWVGSDSGIFSKVEWDGRHIVRCNNNDYALRITDPVLERGLSDEELLKQAGSVKINKMFGN